jgi:protein-S-isoprenylcysteine O-methyltransferase Ste14
MNDFLLKLLLLAQIVLFFVVRVYHNRKAEVEGGKFEYREKNYLALRLFRLGLGLIFLAALVSYFVAPQFVAWARMPLPEWLRWAGLAIGFLNLPLLWWIEATLGKNFSTYLHLRETHTLVTEGPYRWVRHPMYTSLFLFSLAVVLASANWLIGPPLLAGLVVIVVNRVGREEALMLERFGAQYRDYMNRTGRFLPRLSGPGQPANPVNKVGS